MLKTSSGGIWKTFHNGNVWTQCANVQNRVFTGCSSTLRISFSNCTKKRPRACCSGLARPRGMGVSPRQAVRQ
eukprot:9697137-Prorocentrum_lima.AAC.1